MDSPLAIKTWFVPDKCFFYILLAIYFCKSSEIFFMTIDPKVLFFVNIAIDGV